MKRKLTQRKRFLVLERYSFRCQYCGVGVSDGAILHIDHVIPVSKGGNNDIENLVTACSTCNLGKSNLLLEKKEHSFSCSNCTLVFDESDFNAGIVRLRNHVLLCINCFRSFDAKGQNEN